ncbi:Hypothetical protein A7982_05816 [Minicystis rosea]|nr:Hypothetical protein A7982_05816 [Minicystis rosea]
MELSGTPFFDAVRVRHRKDVAGASDVTQGGPSRWRSVLAWLMQLGASLALYFCFTAKIDRYEAMVGAVVAVLAAIASHVILREHVARFSGHVRWMAQAFRLPKYALTGTWEIFTVLFFHLFTRRKAESLLLEVPFVMDDDDEVAATRRALAAAYTTITPNFVVLGFDHERRTLIFHQVKRSKVPEMTRRLGAKP